MSEKKPRGAWRERHNHAELYSGSKGYLAGTVDDSGWVAYGATGGVLALGGGKDWADGMLAVEAAREEAGLGFDLAWVPAAGLAREVMWMVYDPGMGWEEYATEQEARKSLQDSLEYHRAGAQEDGELPDGVLDVRMWRCEEVASIVQIKTAFPGDGTKEGEMCEEDGLEFMWELEIKEVCDE